MCFRPALALAAALSLTACQGSEQSQQSNVATAELTDPVLVPDHVRAALADPERAMHVGADQRRRAAEVIAFSGLKPGDRVLDLIPGDGYWTRVFSRIVGPEGLVYAVWPQAYARTATGNVAQLRQLAATPHYANVRVEVQPSPILSASEPLDMVWTAQNYHDYPDAFMGRTDLAEFNRAVFSLLKPGGTFFIIDHEAAAGSGTRDTERLHRIDPSTVRQQVEAAGFEFVGQSRVLDNPSDDHSRPVFHPSVRGRTDQFVMRFRKPER